MDLMTSETKSETLDNSQNRMTNMEIAEKRLGMTLFIYSIIMLASSFMPEESVLKWLMINSVFTIIVLVTLFTLWKRYKYDSVRYYSYQVYFMLMGIAFFGVTPILKLTYPTSIFWIIVVITLAVLAITHIFRKRIVVSFVNKKHRMLLTILGLYVMIMSVLAIILTQIMRINDSSGKLGMAILFYMLSAVFLVMSPAFIVSKDDVEKLKDV